MAAMPLTTDSCGRLPHVPSDYASRKELWIRSGLWLSCNEGPSVTLSVGDLNYAERLLLDLEKRIAVIADDRARRTELESLTMECAAHSTLWVFGLYEIVRVVKDTNPAKFDGLKGLFEKLEILRMPLAKHEVKGTPKYRNIPHYPSRFWLPESGSVGWWVFNPHVEDVQAFTRIDIANEFLSITANEPIFHDAAPTSRLSPRPRHTLPGNGN
jgi:hypothetical protein